jgi:hypothetical protein
MHIYLFWFATILTTFSSCALVELPLPNSLSSKAIYHLKVKQLHEFSCGFNMLFNGCNIEKWFGFNNCMSDFQNFRKASYDFAAAHKKKRKGSLGQRDIRLLADYLGMKKVVYPYIDEQKQVKFSFSQEVRVTFWQGTPKAEIERMKQQALKKQYDEYVYNLQQEVDTASSYPYILHCACAVDVDPYEEEGHFVLVTLVKNESGRALYICDNMNKRIGESSDTQRCLSYLAGLFSVSPRNTFKYPISEGWVSLRNIEWKLASEVSAPR